MRKALRFRMVSSWKILLVWNLCGCMLLLISPLEFANQEGSIQLLSKSIVLFFFILMAYISMLLFVIYREYDSGKTRWLLLRKHQQEWLFADLIFVMVQLLIVYLIIYLRARSSLYAMLDQLYPKADPNYLQVLFDKAIQASWFSKHLLQLNMLNAGAITLLFGVIAAWSHLVAVSFVMVRVSWIDWALRFSILLLLLAGTSIPIGVLLLFALLIVYIVYGSNHWKLTRMEK